jgi:Cytochrome oxidase assembly protein
MISYVAANDIQSHQAPSSLSHLIVVQLHVTTCVCQQSGELLFTHGLKDPVRHHLAAWLAVCSCWVFSLIVLGGVTRLTRSGLSMTEWKFTGAPCCFLSQRNFIILHASALAAVHVGSECLISTLGSHAACLCNADFSSGGEQLATASD